MAKIIWTASAIRDMDEIGNYIALSSPVAAEKLINKIRNKVQRLELFPESGRIPLGTPELIYREVLVNPCRVFYNHEDDTVYIMRVIRQERDLRNYIIQETKAEYAVG